MTPDDTIRRASLAVELLEFIPPIMRGSLISDTAFSASLGVWTDGEIVFNPAGATFRRSKLLKAIRAASKLDGNGVEVPDLQDAPWLVTFDRSGTAPMVLLSHGTKVAQVRHLGLISERLNDRVSMLEAEVDRVHLPSDTKEHWLALIKDRSLTDDELSDFSEDINTTPVVIGATISATIDQESVHFDVLMPRAGKYYERLVGHWTDEANIKSYCATALPAFLEGLMSFGTLPGLRHGLLLAGHPSVVDSLAGLPVSPEEFHTVAQWALQSGDAVARCAVLELALLRETVTEETKPVLAKIAAGLFVVKGGEDEDFEMLSAAFIFAYGQFSNIKLFPERPNYWRRFAALSQAAMISRCMVPKKGALIEFARELRKLRARSFGMQCYADMRQGPLWQAQWAFPAQLRNEFVGRVISRAASLEQRTRALGLYDILLGEKDGGLRATINDFFMFIAGPLEDNVPLVQELAGDNLALVEKGLAEAKPTSNSFAPLTNSVFIFRMTPELAEKAAQALQRAQYRIEADNPQHFGAALTGLASCAAVTRSVALADAVFTAIRYYRRFSPNELGMDAALRIGSIACASRADMAGWAAAVGALMTDFSFQSLDRDEAHGLRDYLEELCELTPELWATCGPALAAASAIAH